MLTSLSTSVPPTINWDHWDAPDGATIIGLSGNIHAQPPFATYYIGDEWLATPQRRTREQLGTDGNILEEIALPETELRFTYAPGTTSQSVVRYMPLAALWSTGQWQPPFTSDNVWQVTSYYTPPNGFNLEGSGLKLSAIEFVLNSLTIGEHHSGNCDEFGNCDMFPVYSFDFRVNIYGVPEPSCMAIIASLLIWFCRGR